MKISTIFDYNSIQFDKDNEVVLMTSIKAPKIQQASERAPLNLSLVLDVSGSMMGEKIETLKKSVCKLIEQLSEKDTAGVVIFTSFVEEAFKPAKMTVDNKAKAVAAVNALHALDSTNMSGGMLKGFEQLKSLEMAKDSIYRMLLFTDGQANMGLITVEQFKEMVDKQIDKTPITISCFGYGVDHDEALLRNIADAGKGNFYFIKNIEDIGKTFARELGGLLSCFGQNITITLEFKKDSGEFVEVLNDLTTESESKQKLKVTFDDIYTEEEKHLLVKVKLNKVTKAVTQRASNLINGQISFNEMSNKGTFKTIPFKAKISFVKEDKVQKDPEIKVKEQLAIIELAKAHLKAKAFADAGDYTRARNAYTYVTSEFTSLAARGSAVGAYALGPQGPCGPQGVAGECGVLANGTYSTSDSINLSNTSSGLKNFRYVNSDTSLFANTEQKEMEDKFEEDKVEVKDALNVHTLNSTLACPNNITFVIPKEDKLNKKRSR